MKQVKISKDDIKKIEQKLNFFRQRASTYVANPPKTPMVVAYEHFSKSKKAYEVAGIYNLKVCPYCNINYTYVVEKRCRPDFDHFVPKYQNPNLALRVMNLIPCCQQCNSRLKLTTPFSYKNNIHPFLKDFDSLAEFTLSLNSNIAIKNIKKETDFDIKITPKTTTLSADATRVDGNCTALALEERYNHHKNEVVKIINNAYTYIDGFINDIENIVTDEPLLRDTIKKSPYAINLMFPDINCDINSTSLGKMKRDISRFVKDCWEKDV